MGTITEDYVSFEVAKLLKDKGFNGASLYGYNNKAQIIGGGLYYSNDTVQKNIYTAPTHQMAMKWLREEKHIILVFKPATFSGEECTYWTYEIWAGDNFEGEIMSFKTYEEAVEAALKYCLENLI